MPSRWVLSQCLLSEGRNDDSAGPWPSDPHAVPAERRTRDFRFRVGAELFLLEITRGQEETSTQHRQRNQETPGALNPGMKLQVPGEMPRAQLRGSKSDSRACLQGWVEGPTVCSIKSPKGSGKGGTELSQKIQADQGMKTGITVLEKPL